LLCKDIEKVTELREVNTGDENGRKSILLFVLTS